MIHTHKWTNGGTEVLVVRFADKEGKSYHGFQHPMKVGETVTAPDWEPTNKCGQGIHGWPWGFSLGEGKDCDWSALWQVYGVLPENIIGNIEGGDKCKFKTGILRFVGDWHGAMMFVLLGQMAFTVHNSKGSAATSGNCSSAATSGNCSSAATSGDSSSAATSGDRSSAATSGDSSSAATSGYRSSAATSGHRSSAATSGDSSSAATSGHRSSAATSGNCSSAKSIGKSSVAISSGLNGMAMAGEFGCIALAWWNEKENRSEMKCSTTGNRKGDLKPYVWYRVDEKGEFVEVKP